MRCFLRAGAFISEITKKEDIRVNSDVFFLVTRRGIGLTCGFGARLHSNLESASDCHRQSFTTDPFDSPTIQWQKTTPSIGGCCFMVTRRGIEPLLLP